MGCHRGGVRSRRQKSSGAHVLVSVRLENKLWFLSLRGPSRCVISRNSGHRFIARVPVLKSAKMSFKKQCNWRRLVSSGGRGAFLRWCPILDPPIMQSIFDVFNKHTYWIFSNTVKCDFIAINQPTRLRICNGHLP